MSVIRGETLVFSQEGGPDVELVVFGDEFYARYETTDGYTVVYDDPIGHFCYARLVEGELASSKRPTKKGPPPGLRKHIRESAEVRNRKFLSRYRELRQPEPGLSPDIFLSFGRNDGLLDGETVGTGTVRGLTILIEFADETTQITAQQVDDLLNDLQFNAHGNFCSVRRYYQLMSAGKLDYTNSVVGPVRLSGRKSDYISRRAMEEALGLAIQQFNLNLSEFDSRNRGVVDALSFLYAGSTVYRGNLWPHNSTMHVTQGNARTHYYTIQSLGRRLIDLSIGTFTHESGHMLCRFPDLYDYGRRDGDDIDSEGLGRYCLMSSGNHLGLGKVPSPICAYLRDLAGWCDNQIDISNPGQYEAVHGDYGSVMRFVELSREARCLQ